MQWCHIRCHECYVTPTPVPMLHLILIILTTNAVVPVMMTLGLHDADANGITWQKSHVASPFDHLCLRNGRVPLMKVLYHVPLTPASVALHDKKSYVANCFSYLDLMNTVMLLTMPLASHDTYASSKSHTSEKVILHVILIILN